MIAKSDMVILVVSASLLAAGIYRWQSNVSRTYDRPAVSSSPVATGAGNNSQRSNTGSPVAKPDTASVAATTRAGADAAVQTSIGNQQSTTQNTADSVGNASTTGTTADQSGTSNTTGQPLYGTYEVKPGDTLSKIAVDYDTTVAVLRSINDISGSLINVGQSIRYPLPAN